MLPKPEKISEDINITIDVDKRFYWLCKLDKSEIDYLKDHDYIIRTFVNPFKQKKEKFIFQPYSNEGDMHAFMVLLIANYLKNKVYNISLYQTVKPDITFEHNGKAAAQERFGTSAYVVDKSLDRALDYQKYS